MKKWIREKFEDFIEEIYYPDYIGFYGGGIRLLLMLIFLPLWILYKILQNNGRKYL